MGLTRKQRLERAVSDSCPTCGAPLKDVRFWVDVQNNIIVSENRAVQVTPRVAELIWLLRKHFPHTVESERIIARVWNGQDPIDPSRNVLTQVTYARRFLEPLGWTIRNIYGGGYALHKINK